MFVKKGRHALEYSNLKHSCFRYSQHQKLAFMLGKAYATVKIMMYKCLQQSKLAELCKRSLNSHH